MGLVGGGSVINGATLSSSYIRVGCDGRCGEDSEALPACNTSLAPAPGPAPAPVPAPATAPAHAPGVCLYLFEFVCPISLVLSWFSLKLFF